MIDAVFIIGPMRTGTTYLEGLLRSTTLFRFPRSTKESFYLDLKRFSIEEYLTRFSAEDENLPIAESAPYVFTSEQAMLNIAANFKNPLLLSVYRNQEALRRSIAGHMEAYGLDSKAGISSPTQLSDYRTFLPKWRRLVPAARCILLDFASLERNPEQLLRKIVGCSASDVCEVNFQEIALEKNSASVARSKRVNRWKTHLSIFLKRNNILVFHRVYEKLSLKKVFNKAASFPRESSLIDHLTEDDCQEFSDLGWEILS